VLDFSIGSGIIPPVEFATFPAIFLLTSISGVVGWLTASAAIWALKRSHYRLECDVTDLQNSLLTEIKRRAGKASKESQKNDEELAAKILEAATQPNSTPKNWWDQYVHKDLRGH